MKCQIKQDVHILHSNMLNPKPPSASLRFRSFDIIKSSLFLPFNTIIHLDKQIFPWQPSKTPPAGSIRSTLQELTSILPARKLGELYWIQYTSPLWLKELPWNCFFPFTTTCNLTYLIHNIYSPYLIFWNVYVHTASADQTLDESSKKKPWQNTPKSPTHKELPLEVYPQELYVSSLLLFGR